MLYGPFDEGGLRSRLPISHGDGNDKTIGLASDRVLVSLLRLRTSTVSSDVWCKGAKN